MEKEEGSSSTKREKTKPQHHCLNDDKATPSTDAIPNPTKDNMVTITTSLSAEINGTCSTSTSSTRSDPSSRSAIRIRQIPPSAFQTPPSRQSHHHTQQQYYQDIVVGSDRNVVPSFGSPFTSPPLRSTFTRRCTSESLSTTSKTRQRQPQNLPYRTIDNADSPFLSPLNKTSITTNRRKERPEPLVLDPSSRTSSHQTRSYHYGNSTPQQYPNHQPLSSSMSSAHSSRSLPGVQKLIQVATQSIRDHHATTSEGYYDDTNASNQYSHATPTIAYSTSISNNTATNNTTTVPITKAADIACDINTIRAGFLYKLGQNIPEYKRRFFVLKSELNLYYYVSPTDIEPRGKIDIERTQIDTIEELSDGRYRFVISWNQSPQQQDNNSGNDTSNKTNRDIMVEPCKRIILEAKSKEIADEWMKHMKQERVSVLKDQVENLTNVTTTQQNRIIELERQIDHYRMVEKDRDGALEDAQNWRNKFERLDEALRLLTQQIRKPPLESITSTPATLKVHEKDSEITDSNFHQEEKIRTPLEEEKKDDDSNEDVHISNASEADTVNSNKIESTSTQSDRAPASLLDNFAQQEMNVEEIFDVPGTYFSALSNACRQQRESLRLASIEASTAVEDVLTANERVDAIQSRMQKAEKQILKLWEENCNIRKSLKQKKREKRVLVREVKQLQQTIKNFRTNEGDFKTGQHTCRVEDEDAQMADTMVGSDEERLITEIEEHVASSIQLHERLLAGNEFVTGANDILDMSMEDSISTNPPSVNHGDITDREGGKVGIVFDRKLSSQPISSDATVIPDSTTSNKSNFVSLLDDDSESDSDSESPIAYELGKSNRRDLRQDIHSATTSISSTRAELGDHESICTGSVASTVDLPCSQASVDSSTSTPERPNPLLNLDDKSLADHPLTGKKLLVRSSSVTDNGQATSRLVCPLADVVESRASHSMSKQQHEESEEVRVQHLTFYSGKIGIQFQKAPPAPAKPRGLLTDALTADLHGKRNGSQKTAAELRSIASIASIANGGIESDGKEYCPLAMPEDIVLVCGFQGFDDSGTNQRPKLGARLVAFDGVSVEVGKWTFDSIRKAIKARGRPITLSFRNDFLTTEQRAILTKAVMEVDSKRPIPRRIVNHERPASTTHSINSALSYESEYVVEGKIDVQGSNVFTNSGTALRKIGGSAAENKHWQRVPFSSSSASSVSSGGRDSHGIPKMSSTSESTQKSTNIRSFSDGGSSSVISTALGPLMKNLLKGVPSTSSSEHGRAVAEEIRRKFEPDYLHREYTRSDSTPQHQDFQSNLL